MNRPGKVLFIDDEEDVRHATSQTLELEGFAVTALSSADDALAMLSRDWPGIVVTDIRMPGMDGMGLLGRINEIDPDLPVVLVTGHGDVALAVRAMREGAYDFVEKPADPDYLVDVVRRALDRRNLVIENRALRRELDSMGTMERRLIGKSAAMEALRRTIVNLADTDVDVLIVGETGTGKELVARCLHDFGSRRARRFVALNCGALPESVIESELFGHESGAFTGANRRRIGKIEHAEGGTLFLDEIESMPMSVQVKLLRVLQERCIERLGGNETVPVDIRVIAAAKEDLRQACDAGAFRDDLYYRLHVANIVVPPLRDRRDDVPLLLRYFAEAAGQRYRRPVPAMTAAWMNRQRTRAWPGNVRELRNAAERFVLGMTIGGGDTEITAAASDAGDDDGGSLAERLARVERETLADALRRHGGRVGATARALGVSRKNLYLRMRKHGLDRKDFR